MNSEPIPAAIETEALATAFVNGLQKQQEDAVSKYMEGFVGKMMTDKKPK